MKILTLILTFMYILLPLLNIIPVTQTTDNTTDNIPLWNDVPFPITGDEADIDNDEWKQWLNFEMKTIGPVDTYEDYISSRPDQPFKWNVENNMVKSEKANNTSIWTVVVFVELGIRPFLLGELNIYMTDLENAGYTPIQISVSGGTAQDLKDILVSYYLNSSHDLVGSVLVGDLPCAWFYHENDFDGNPSSFPCDLFLMDMDGNWADVDDDGQYDSHTNLTGTTAPEVFTGRIDASRVPGLEIEILKNYFDKVHRFWRGEMPRTYRGLTYTDHDWAGGNSFRHSMGRAYEDYEALYWPDVDRNDYMDNRVLNDSYEFIQLACHSGSGAHYFHDNGSVSSAQIRAAPPRSLFYNLFCCSGARFTNNNCLGYAYTMNTGTDSLISIGSTKTGSMLAFDDFYEPLGEGYSFGGAFREWFERQAPYSNTPGGYNEMSWYYGMAVLGDPTLVLFKPRTVYVDDDFNSQTQGWGKDRFSNIGKATNRVREGGTIEVFPGNYRGDIFLNETVILKGTQKDDPPVIVCESSGAGITVNEKGCSLLDMNITGTQINGSTGIVIRNDNVAVDGISISGMEKGITLENVENTFLSNNEIGGGLRLIGNGLSQYDSHNIGHTNTVNGKTLYYHVNAGGGSRAREQDDVGQIILVNCTNMTTNDLVLNKCWAPLQIYYSEECTVANNTFINNTMGVVLNGNDCLITDNTFLNNTEYGLNILDGSGNQIYHNNFLNNNYGDIQGSDSGTKNRFHYNGSGNHWSDMVGPDSDHDGIVDIGYLLDGEGDSVDENALVSPWGTPTLLWDRMNISIPEDVFHSQQFEVANTNDQISWSLHTNCGFLELHDNGSLMGTPSNVNVGQWWVNVSISTERGGCSANYSLEVLNVNDDPVITSFMAGDIWEDRIFQYSLLATDPDPTGDILAWTIDTRATFLTLNETSGNLSGIPTNEDVGEWWVNVSVHDGHGGNDHFNFTLNVKNTNDAPIIEGNYTGYCPQGEFYKETFWGYDPDPTGDILMWHCFTNATFLMFDSTNHILEGTPQNMDVGNWSVNISVEDGKGGEAWYNYIIVVNNTNDAPQDVLIELQDKYVEGATQIFTGFAMDRDSIYGDELNWTWRVNGTVVGYGPTLAGNLTAGHYNITLNVTDSQEAWNSTSVNIVVNSAESNINPDDHTNDGDDNNDEGRGQEVGEISNLNYWVLAIIVIVCALVIFLVGIFTRTRGKSGQKGRATTEPGEKNEAHTGERERQNVEFTIEPDEVRTEGIRKDVKKISDGNDEGGMTDEEGLEIDEAMEDILG